MAGLERYGAGSIVVSDYDPAWPVMYQQESTQVQRALGSIVVAFEHVGSTAVQGLAAKPIIDVLVGVRSLSEARPRSIETLQALGYTHMLEYEFGCRTRCYSGRDLPVRGPTTFM